MRRALVASFAIAAAACGGSGQIAKITVSSSAFAPGARIPRAFTCDGQDVSLPLRWTGIPSSATELRLIMNDTDAGNFVHWQLSGLSPRSSGLAAGQAPAMGNAGTNSFGTTGYRGPCPPRGARAHHYVITVTALSSDQTVGLGTLTGTYSR